MDVIIVGAGVIGALIARELSFYKLDTLIIEKENDVGNVTSMANSAIVHSGYDPVPGTKKAYYNVRGNALFKDLCHKLHVSLGAIGSLTVATEDEQLKILEELKERSAINGVEVKLLNREETLALEPGLVDEVKGSLYAPSAMIVNPFTLTSRAVENALENGVKIHLNEEVIDIIEEHEGFEVITNKDSYHTKVVINCAGLYGDKIAKLIEPDLDFEIKPRKGEYYVLDHYGKQLVRHVIFPLPSSKGKGILVTPTTSNNFLVGPSSEFVDEKDDYSTDKPTLDAVKKGAASLVKNIPYNEMIRVFSGLRPTPSTHDFYIESAKNHNSFINVIGIESPGLASSPAIADEVVHNLVGKVLTLHKKDHFRVTANRRVHIKSMRRDDANKLIAQHPEYGKIICNCEKISLGELMDELKSPLPPRTIKAVKKRLRIGFGKCQGGFCQAKIVQLLANYYHCDMTEILYDKEGSYLLKEETKKEAK